MSTTVAAMPTCPYCGSYPHQGICPKVSAVDYYPDGSIKRVELHSAWGIQVKQVPFRPITIDETP